MSGLWPVILVASVKPSPTPPTWYLEKLTPTYIDEGDVATYQLSGINLPVGAKISLWITDPMASNNNWAEGWETVFRREVEAKGGLDLVKLSPTGVPKGSGYLDVMLTTNASFVNGTKYTFTNATRRNRADNQTLLPDGKTMGRQFQMLLKLIPAAEGGLPTDGVRGGKGGSYTNVRDTSRTPAGVPTMKVQSFGANGGPAVGTIREGDQFQIRITGWNVANTVLTMYAANLGQYDITPSLRSALPAACAAAGCTARVPNWTPETSLDWFNGGYITFPQSYVDGTPIILNFTATRDNVEEPEKQLDILSAIYREGDIADFGGVANPAGNWDANTVYKQKDWVFYLPTGRRFIYTAGLPTKGNLPPTDEGDTYETAFWREYFPVVFSGNSHSRIILDIPARYWELRATTDGTTITYTLQGPHASDSSVALTSVNAPPGFDAALRSAIDASGFMALANGRLSTTNITQAGGAVTFTVPHAGSGKHTMRLTDLQGSVNSYIVIGDACVFLTPPVINTVRNLHGWNAAGGEFGSAITPNFTPTKGFSFWQTNPGERSKYAGGRYYYPSKPENPAAPHQQMDYFYAMGARYMRLPIKRAYLQWEHFGPLYYGEDAPFTASSKQDMRRVIELVDYWTSLPGARVLIDDHSYGEVTYDYYLQDGVLYYTSERVRYNQPDARARPENLVDFIIRLVTVFENNPKVDIDFQNEPKEVGSSIAPAQWAATMQWLTNAVRARTNFLGIIHRETTEYASAQNFVKSGNAAANVDSYDPARNMVFHVHSYNDKDGSGTSGACVADAGRNRLVAVTEWARANGFTRDNGYGVFIGETAAGAASVAGQETCGPVIANELQYILDNSDVILGSTWWASGFGPNYPFSLDPSNNNYVAPTHTPNMLLVSQYWNTGNGLS
jgi:hypothetical protein